ncbi:MAG: MSC_0882 family membrane protein [Mycoplasma sp.]
MKDFTIFDNTDEFDVKEIQEKYKNKNSKVEIIEETIWSQPMEEVWGFSSKSDPDRTKPVIDLNIDDELSDTPDSYIRNNQTIRLKNDEEPSIRFDPEPTKKRSNKLKTVRFEQTSSGLNDDLVNKNIHPNKFEISSNEFIESKILFKNEDAKEEITEKLNLSEQPEVQVNIEEQRILEKQKKKTENKERKKLLLEQKKEQRREFKKATPKFFRFEVNVSLYLFIFVSILSVVSLAGLGYVLFAIFNKDTSPYWIIMPVVTSLLSLFSFANCGLNYRNLKKERKMNNNLFEKEIPYTSISKVYKKLVTANLNLNWTCLSIYTLLGLGILTTYIVTYFMNLWAFYINDFTYLIIEGTNYAPVYAVWIMLSIIILTFIYNLVFFLVNKKRKSEIELFYQKELISDEVQLKLRKNANKRGSICFAFSSLFIGLIVLVTYFCLKRKTKK